jgi:hypothetical protein
MNKNFTYFSPVIQQKATNIRPELWAKVQDYWEKGLYRKCILETLRYLGIDAADNQNEFLLYHGSIVIHLSVLEEKIEIRAPFLDISKGQQLPLLRQAAQINFEPMTLTQIILQDNKLVFVVDVPLELCEPYKLYDILKEICLHADNYDDAFIKRFRAARTAEPFIMPADELQKAVAISCFRTIFDETNQAITFLEQKRMHTYMWDVLILFLLRIDFTISPQGHLRGRLEKYISDMIGTFDLSEKIVLGKAALKEFSKLKDEEIAEDLYLIQTLVPFKTLATADTLKSRLQRALSQVEKEYQDGEYLACSLTAPYHLLYLLYEYSLSPDHVQLLQDLLPGSSGMPFKEAAEYYLQKLKEIISGISQSPLVLPDMDTSTVYHPIITP